MVKNSNFQANKLGKEEKYENAYRSSPIPVPSLCFFYTLFQLKIVSVSNLFENINIVPYIIHCNEHGCSRVVSFFFASLPLQKQV